ncbi:MAG: hypothetical protein JKY66_11245 [Spongiibacteraceae bacterium]|nr:hypothetical protein [Spongiibacteraceae bacterium]
MYYQYDGLGSTRSLSDENGIITDSYDYEAFGEVLNQTGTTENNYKFTGEQYDQDLNQYYLRARYYNQNNGRFTQQDTWMGNNHDPITLHKYLYANADPVNYIDPTGNFTIGSLMTAVNVLSTLATTAQTSYNFYQIATGQEELTAKNVGLAIIFGLTNKVGGKYISKYAEKYADSLKKFLSKIGCNSFAANTLITTANGLIEIQNVQIGDRVQTLNESTGELEYHKVIHVISGEKLKETLTITLSTDEVIEATPGHLIYVDEQWIAAEDINIGQSLYSLGKKVSVKSVAISSIKVKVYNLTVEGNHNYFVGQDGVLVHNISPCEKAAKSLAAMVPKSCVGNLKCDKFTLEYEKLLLSNKVKGKRLCVKSATGRLASLKDKIISTNGSHFAVQVGELVFDNNNPNGIKYSSWADDIGVGEDPRINIKSEAMTGGRNGCIP